MRAKGNNCLYLMGNRTDGKRLESLGARVRNTTSQTVRGDPGRSLRFSKTWGGGVSDAQRGQKTTKIPGVLTINPELRCSNLRGSKIPRKGISHCQIPTSEFLMQRVWGGAGNF